MPMTPDVVWEALDEAGLAQQPAANLEFELESGKRPTTDRSRMTRDDTTRRRGGRRPGPLRRGRSGTIYRGRSAPIGRGRRTNGRNRRLDDRTPALESQRALRAGDGRPPGAAGLCQRRGSSRRHRRRRTPRLDRRRRLRPVDRRGRSSSGYRGGRGPADRYRTRPRPDRPRGSRGVSDALSQRGHPRGVSRAGQHGAGSVARR